MSSEENVAKGVMSALKSFCTRRLGRRDVGGSMRDADFMDEELFERLKVILTMAVAD